MFSAPVQLGDLKPGMRVRISQEIDRREGNWKLEVTGEVIETFSQKTGSWNAHGKEDKLWLNRVKIRKDNGELSVMSVDPFTRYELLS
jgi:hypothetical protein